MAFNSIAFALFLPIVFLLYWFLPKRLFTQNLLLLVASYFFYAWWDYRFLALLFISSLLNFLLGIGMEAAPNQSRRKLLLFLKNPQSICRKPSFACAVLNVRSC